MERYLMYKITEQDKKQLLTYLMKRPYVEVATLIGMVVSLSPIDSKEKNGKDKAQ